MLPDVLSFAVCCHFMPFILYYRVVKNTNNKQVLLRCEVTSITSTQSGLFPVQKLKNSPKKVINKKLFHCKIFVFCVKVLIAGGGGGQL